MNKLSTTLVCLVFLILINACGSTGPKEVIDQASKPVSIAGQTASYVVQCNGKQQNIVELIQPIASDLTAQKISYKTYPVSEWRDCSGIFLRFSSYLATKCPNQASYLAAPAGITPFVPGEKNFKPGREKARSSRALAQWYHSQGRFTPIYYDPAAKVSQPSSDLVLNRNRIRVGSVLWFAKAKPRLEDGLDGLFNKTFIRGPHINHMAIVTAVKYDQQGNVSEYEMYHGQNARKPAGTTKTQYWKWPSAFLHGGKKAYPPLGYWDQYLVGVGDLLPSI